MRSWILLAALLSTAVLAGPAYKWVDENGQVNYSDRPRPGAEKVQLPSYRSPGDNRPARPAVAQATPAEEPANPDRPYDLLEISAPTEQETLWNTAGKLNVAVNMSPRLRRGHRLAVYLDGGRLNINPPSTNFVLPEVVRGEHRLQVAVIDGFDQEVVRTLPRRFMMQQATAVATPNPNPGANPANPSTGPNSANPSTGPNSANPSTGANPANPSTGPNPRNPNRANRPGN